ncbi:Hsp20 family protein [Oxalobacteraceae bacterium R-40]|uniref:Hsp20 family protein n=1 Tax=Keguizhuia sedimenti TaxID=3064264 RepID=A0ABU1BNL4_9BURK|nr:Hsp20 family protein [Oxalobacteraceae bacterium R-40]
MARIEHTVEVNAPLQAVYNQWTQFEEFPRFMEGVREVRQLDDVHLHWRADRSGRQVEWDSEITDQVPDQHIAWRDLSGPGNTGVVNFYPVDESKTRVQLVMESHPHVPPSEAAMAELVTTQRIEQDMARFKRLLEAQGEESGAWRGEIHFSQPAISGDSAQSTDSASGADKMPHTQGAGTKMPDVDEKGQSIFAQQVSPSLGEEPARNKSEAGGKQFTVSEEAPAAVHAGDAPRGQQTKGDTDPRTASLDNAVGTSGLGASSTGGIQGAQGSRTDEAVQQQADSTGKQEQGEQQGRQGGPQTWLPNILQGWDDPMAVMRKMAEEMDQLFGRFIGRPMANRAGQGGMAGKWMPSIEIRQHENHLHVYAELPGIKKEDVHIEILHDKLSIEGQRHEHHYQTAQGYKRSERSYGRFYRMIPLPQGVDPESVKATMQEGLLEIKVPLPMPSSQQGRRIDIQPSDSAQSPQGGSS